MSSFPIILIVFHKNSIIYSFTYQCTSTNIGMHDQATCLTFHHIKQHWNNRIAFWIQRLVNTLLIILCQQVSIQQIKYSKCWIFIFPLTWFWNTLISKSKNPDWIIYLPISLNWAICYITWSWLIYTSP